MLILVKDVSDGRSALLVDRVSEILTVPESAVITVDKEYSFNGCTEAEVCIGDQVIHLLCPSRILLREERDALSEFQAVAQRRLQNWEPETT
jgi:purine-binding chemotaxis protein CheW